MNATTWLKGSPLLSYFLTSFCRAEGLTLLPSFATLLGGLLASDSILDIGIALEPYVLPGFLSTRAGYEIMGCSGLGMELIVPVESLKGCMAGGSPSME